MIRNGRHRHAHRQFLVAPVAPHPSHPPLLRSRGCLTISQEPTVKVTHTMEATTQQVGTLE